MRLNFVWVALVVFTTGAYSQIQHEDLVSYKSKYPDKSRIVIKDITEIRIDINKSDSLDIESSYISEAIYLDKNAPNYTERSVSSSYFRKLLKLEASSFVPTKEDKYKEYKVKDFEEKKVLSASIFFDDSRVTSFKFPNLREGAKTYINYSVSTNTPQLTSGCYFGDYTNVEHQEFKVIHHQDVTISFKMFNGIDSLVSYTKSQKGDYITHSWVAKNMEPLEFEGGGPSFESRAPHIYPIINEYKVKDKTIPVLRDVNDLHAWYASLLNRSGIEDYEPLRLFVDSLTKGSSTDIEKVELIYDWVQKDVKYVAYEDGLGGFIPRPPQLVFQRKYGDCKDMALLQVKMLEYAGVEGAHVGWVGTRSKPYKYEELPSPGCDNHMIAVFETENDNWIFLDATGTYTPFGYPSEFIQGKEVMVHKGDSTYLIVEVPQVQNTHNLSSDSVFIKINDGVLTGEGVVTYKGYPYSDLKYRVLDTDSIHRSKVLKSYLEKGSNKFFFTLKDFEFGDPVEGKVTYDFTIEDYLKQNKDEVYLNLNLEKVLSEDKIEKDRKSAIETDHTLFYESTYVIDLGDEYSVSYLPTDKMFENEKFGFKISYNQVGNVIIYKLTLDLNYLSLDPAEFDEWNSMVKAMNKKYKEVVVLKKN